ncbi:DUF6159 family protein [Halopiger djelfimassiliensis]|uniref:DUF6159 family protein n=1 Tax=Halopiger djelfimassiliensis TaxID=1293047 RepID=UPI000677B291|nr:DUF6159 family protein [Halopiger djelfimassiliensis]
MGIGSRLKTGFALSVASLRVLRSHPKLAVYPLCSGIASTLFVLALLGPLVLVSGGSLGWLELAGLFVVYVGSTYITALFNAGLVYSVREVFRGNDPHIGDGLSAAASHSGPLLVWAVASAVVGIAIRLLESRGEIGARIAALVFSVGWTIATFFVIPVIVFEEPSPTGMFSRSASVFTETWGETAGARLGLGIVPGLITIVGLGSIVVAAVVLPGPVSFGAIVTIGLVTVVAALLVSGVISGVVKTALYLYATESIHPEAFDGYDFDALMDSGSGTAGRVPGRTNRGI